MSTTNNRNSIPNDSSDTDSSLELNDYANTTNNETQNVNNISVSRSSSWYWFLGNRRPDEEEHAAERTTNYHPTTQNANDNLPNPRWPSNVRPELAFLSALTGRQVAPLVHQVRTVKFPVNINRASIQLISMDDEHNLYKLHFLFDSNVPCIARVFYHVADSTPLDDASTDKPTELKPAPEAVSTIPIRYQQGFELVYEQPPQDFLDLSTFKPEEFQTVPVIDHTVYPVAIILQAEELENNKSITAQITYATLIRCADGSCAIKPVKQKILHNGKVYIVNQVFGIENEDTETGKECVICMAEPRNTVLLPCRHLCLCAECAQALRQQTHKCPICRSTVKHMLEVHLADNSESSTPDSDTDEENESKLVIKKRAPEST
mmetsp:Transcript_12170/g.16812  ORF Transcript_12170/g.16812 Transcript_12170/m.16812 type:complete len:377 (+) Transcript_12170:23-1153(+)